MFRQDEVFVGGWREKTIEAMQRRRFEMLVARLPPLGAQRLEVLTPNAFERRIESSWQEIEKKPMRSQQMAAVRKSVLESVDAHADCLSKEEHELVERALILGGSARIEDAQELEAAHALSLRLWASVGLVSGRPYIELERAVMEPVAKAMARDEHERIRSRLEEFRSCLSGMLYRAGVLDDRLPQQMLLREIAGVCGRKDSGELLARHYLWSSCDCIDYGEGVMLLHPALAEPRHLLAGVRRRSSLLLLQNAAGLSGMDILPEEIPLQEALELTIEGALRDGHRGKDVARDIRFLCKQGAPLDAMEDVLQSSLIVLLSSSMRGALRNMYYMTPKWIECAQHTALQ